MSEIENIRQLAEALEELGYPVTANEDAAHVAIGGVEKPFAASLTINSHQELVITAQVARLKDFNEDDLPLVMFGLLDANTRIRPYAFGIITDGEDEGDAGDIPIVVTDSLKVGDLCKAELAASMDSLLVALNASGEALRAGLGK